MKELNTGDRLGVKTRTQSFLVFEVKRVTKNLAYVEAINAVNPSGVFKVKRELKEVGGRHIAFWYGKITWDMKQYYNLYLFDDECQSLEKGYRTTYALKFGVEKLRRKVENLNTPDKVDREKAVIKLISIMEELDMDVEPVRQILAGER